MWSAHPVKPWSSSYKNIYTQSGQSCFIVPAPEAAAAFGVIAGKVVRVLAVPGAGIVACRGAPVQGRLQHGLVSAAAERRARGRGWVQPPKGEVDPRAAADWMPAHRLAPRHLHNGRPK